MTRFFVQMLSLGVMVLAAGVGLSQEYPNKPIRIVTGGVGGGLDFVARLIAPGLTGSLGQPVIIDNRGGIVPGEIVSRAPPDGYTLLVAGGNFITGPLLQDNVPYDTATAFSPITWASSNFYVLVVHPSLPVKSVKELIALANAKPGALNYSSGVTGSVSHLAAELFKDMANVNIVRIPYKSGAQEMADLIGGHVQLTFGNVAQVMALFKVGKLRALAITNPQPSKLVPGLPTVAATVPGFESVGMTGMLAPAKTPDAIINRLNYEIVQILSRADLKQKLFDAGIEVVSSSPQQYATAIKSEITRIGKLIKKTGMRAE